MSIHRPMVVNYGMGVDSTALLIEFARRNLRPDLVIFADTGGEKPETLRYRDVMERFLRRVGFPRLVVVKYRPKKFKNYPPYHDLETNCLSNGTLPSLAFGFKSCSLKWKAAPIHDFVQRWRPAQDCWTSGQRVLKVIGYDASPADMRRKNHAGSFEDPKYEYRYPLVEWGWTRNRCITEIVNEGLPGWDPAYLEAAAQAETVDDMLTVKKRLRWIPKGGIPMKSSCFFCPAMKKWEVALLNRDQLERVVIMEARAKPRHHTCEGLWRKATKTKPGSMSEFILTRGLLPEARVRELQAQVPKRLMSTVEDWREGQPVETWDEFFDGVGVEGFCSPDVP